MDILGLSTSPSSGGAYALVLNEIDGNRRLPIIIGTFEAQAIALELEHIKPPRPMTHDLLKNTIENLGAKIDQVYINDLSEGTFFARIFYHKNGEQLQQDARPSDAIALAVRFKSPIFVAPDVLDEAGIVSDKEKTSSAEELHHAESHSSGLSKVEKLENKLQMAIETENYEKAARLRDQINKLKG